MRRLLIVIRAAVVSAVILSTVEKWPKYFPLRNKRNFIETQHAYAFFSITTIKWQFNWLALLLMFSFVLLAQRHSMFGLYVNYLWWARIEFHHDVEFVDAFWMCQFWKRTFFNCFARWRHVHTHKHTYTQDCFLLSELWGIFLVNVLYTLAKVSKVEHSNSIEKENISSIQEQQQLQQIKDGVRLTDKSIRFELR